MGENPVRVMDDCQPHLTLVIHALNTGGAERVLGQLANHWVERGVDIALITLADVGSDDYELDPCVRRIGLDLQANSRGLWQALRNNQRRITRLRQAVQQSGPPNVISFTDQMNVLTLAAAKRTNWRVVIAERNDPRHQSMGRVWEFLRRRYYPACQAAVVQTSNVAEHLKHWIGEKPIYTIPNGVASSASRRVATGGDGDCPVTIVSMGRLTKQKGFDLLLRACAQLIDLKQPWRLRIYGDGPQHAELETLVQRLGLTTHVRLCGRIRAPAVAFEQADVFALPSRYEGFPNALLEAMAAGLPAVAFDCPSGPGEIVRDQWDGLLVAPGDVTSLAQALRRLICDADGRTAMGQRAVDVVQRFSMEMFFNTWDRVLRNEFGITLDRT